jgi:3-hydroxyacyl-CoA dehydrogenase
MAVELSRHDNILLATVSNPPVNALSRIEREGLIEAIRTAEAEGVAAVVIMGAGHSFIAGADVKEFGKPSVPPFLPDVVLAIEKCLIPVIAAIEGQALGGGLEIALGCHFRIAGAGARLGLPEVTLGVVPGAGGTQRLPRLIDPILAATMVSTGKPVSAAEALSSGLVDEIVEGDLLAAALRYAAGKVGISPDDRRLSARIIGNPGQFRNGLEQLMVSTVRQARGATAPRAALELVMCALDNSFDDGIARERETFLCLRASDEAAALRHIFFAERAAAKPTADVAEASPRPVSLVGIIGAGTMGTGIAMSFADAGFPVTIIEMSTEALARGMGRITQAYRTSAERGRITSAEADVRIALIGGSQDYLHLADRDLIVEAAFEAMDVKLEIFARLDQVARPGAVLATNTSYLDLDAIAASVSRPADVIGLHYFSPANIMRLLEVVRGRKTAPDVLATAILVARRLGKTPVVSGVCNGFIGNRMLRAYVREAGLLLLEGAMPEQIDNALVRFGMAMGPFAVADLSGIDIGYKARKAMPEDSFEPLATIVHDRLVEAGQLGQKSGSGFYRYEAGGRGKTANPLIEGFVAQARLDAQMSPRAIDDKEIVERCVYALASEGGVILDEDIAARSGDIDVVYVNGYGFPRHRGGPMFYVEQYGLDAVRARIAPWSAGRFGRWWKSSRFLQGGQAPPS